MKMQALVEVRKLGAIGEFSWDRPIFECEHEGLGRIQCLFDHLTTLGLEPRVVRWIAPYHPDVDDAGTASHDSMMGPL